MCQNLTGLDFLRVFLPEQLVNFTVLDRNIVLYLMKQGVSIPEISFYSGSSKEEVDNLIEGD